VLIESGFCTFLTGVVPYEFRSINFNNVTHYYFKVLPSNTTFNITSSPVTFSSACPNPGSGFSALFSFYQCSLIANTFTVAQINLRYNYALDIRPINMTNAFQFNTPVNFEYTGVIPTRARCSPNTIAIEPRTLFSTNVDGFQFSGSIITNVSVTSLRIVEPIRLLLPYTSLQ
jgi:hypothetical protein